MSYDNIANIKQLLYTFKFPSLNDYISFISIEIVAKVVQKIKIFL